MIFKRNALMCMTAALVLTACGGSDSAPSPQANQSGQTGTTTPTGSSGADCSTISELPALTGLANLTANNVSLSSDGSKYLIKGNPTSIIAIAGNSNTVKIEDNTTVASVMLSGQKNIFVLGKGAVATSFTVTGVDNTIYLPQGTTTIIANRSTMAASNQVKCYK